MKILEPIDVDYINSLPAIWRERYQRLYRIQIEKKKRPEFAAQIAYNLVKQWKETGQL